MLIYTERDFTIKCPVCNKELLDVSGTTDRVYKIKCRKCRKWIWANPANGYREVKKVPPRTTAGGMRFY